MYTLFSSGYSDQLLSFSMDDVSGKLNLTGQTKIGENASFGMISNNTKTSDVYFVHETENFENKFINSGAVSRWEFIYRIQKLILS